MLNRLWLSFFLITVLCVAYQSIFANDLEISTRVVMAWFDAARVSVDISIGLIGLMTLWLGLFKVAEHAGLIAGSWLKPTFCSPNAGGAKRSPSFRRDDHELVCQCAGS